MPCELANTDKGLHTSGLVCTPLVCYQLSYCVIYKIIIIITPQIYDLAGNEEEEQISEVGSIHSLYNPE